MAPVFCPRTGHPLDARKGLLIGMISLCAALPLQAGAQTQGEASQPASEVGQRYFKVPAGDLERALTDFGQQADLLLSFPAALTEGLQSAGLDGNYSVTQALERLLYGTRMEAVAQSENAYWIKRSTGPADRLAPAALPQMLVVGHQTDADVKVIESDEMRDAMRSDLAETLSLLPSVRVDNTASSSLQQGDLKPAELSIRGAAAYQNKIMLDGGSIDNLLDPALKESADNYTSVAGHSQGLFVDTDFLGRIEVIDVNASASEGGFSGGVVKAETRAYDGRDSFDINVRGTRDSWTSFHVDKSQEGEFSDGAAQAVTGVPGEFQPNFSKSEGSVNGATRFGDIGVFAGFSEKRSTIRQKQVAALDWDYFAETGRIFKPGEETSLDSRSRFGVVRMDLLERDYELNASLAYSDFSEDSFLINYRDSDFESQHNGLNLSVNFATDLGATRMDLNVNAGITADEREYANNVLNQYKNTSIYDSGMVGGFGDLANEQRTLGASAKFNTPLTRSLNLAYGAEASWIDYQQDRGIDFIVNEYKLDFTQPLPPQTSPGSWAPEDQYQTSEIIYQAGKLDFSNINSALFTELAGEHDRLFWRTGTRLERDGWLGNTNFAPRLLAGINLGADHQYRLAAGANRYYGKSFLSYRLREKERSLLIVRERTSPDDPFELVDSARRWQYLDLNTPYDDEYSLGLSGPLLTGQAGIQLVQRRGEDQIRTERDNDRDIEWFENSGSSLTHQVDLFWRSRPMHWMGINWAVHSTASWMDKETDSTYGDGSGGYLSTDDGNEEVIFEGSRIKRRDLPADDFATPISINLDLISHALDDRLFVRNSLAFTDGYQSLRRLSREPATGLYRYEVEEQGSALRWDMSVEYQLMREASPYVRVDLVNVTDNDNVVRAESGVQLFGVGRQYWLEVGYRF
ncbi:TonB-dependent receptor [Halopseudomonas salina]|uniref:TonB-dependent receptor n=1 Tax=Halopseudomonas salina TaxID=1323744 RepID=A0ABQ1P145_9GAMM|nr:TonB-dependent receptor [Halopseudomonas salina]GGC89023.1 TonB-dependent receptor [Halopseudomonas salina]